MTNIGGHLSQSKEYRDIFDDILHLVKVKNAFNKYFFLFIVHDLLQIGETLHEAGLDRQEANLFMIACNSMISGIRDILFRKLDRLDTAKKQRKLNIIEMDWIRFVLCCRICLWNMFGAL